MQHEEMGESLEVESDPTFPLLFPMSSEDRRDFRMAFDAHQGFVKRGARLFQVLARSRPLRYYGSEKIDRAQFRATEIRTRREQLGEHFPMLVQPRARAGRGAIPHRGGGLHVAA